MSFIGFILNSSEKFQNAFTINYLNENNLTIAL